MESKHEAIREQARALHNTLRLIKNRVIARHSAKIAARAAQVDTGPPDLTLPQMNCLTTIRDHGEVTIKALAEALGISPPSASAMVDRLVEMGAARREQSTTDRREVVVSLSEEGAQGLDAMEENILECIEELLERVGPECARHWCEVYERIREALFEDSEAPRKTTGREA